MTRKNASATRKEKILFAADFSAACRPALAEAVRLARALQAELVITHVLALVVPVGGMYITPSTWDAIEKGAEAAARKQLDRLLGAARKAGARAQGLLMSGYSADQIVRAAKLRKATFIVMGTHGRTGLSRLVMGSVAARVVATAPCPVLTVRGKR